VFAVQIARHLGAKVMAVCSESNHPLVSNLGAQEVMDYTHKDFTQQDRHFDLVFDARGNRTAGECERILEPGGRFVTTEVTLTRTLSAVLNPLRGKSRHAVMVRSNRDDLTLLAQWVEDGVLRPVVERVYPRATMLEALKHLRSKRAKGKLVIDW